MTSPDEKDGLTQSFGLVFEDGSSRLNDGLPALGADAE
jgi:hypothetical protein